jgi:hypothetical protein
VIGLWLLAIVYALWSSWPVIGPIEPRDFTIFWLSGKLALAGQPEIAYSREAFAAFAQSMTGMERASAPYPPHMFLLFAPLALAGLTPAFLIWNALGVALFTWAAKPYMKGVPWLLAALTPAACISIALGQTGLLIGALWLFAFRGRAWAVGLLTLKPHLGWLTALTLRRPGQWLTAILAAVLVMALAAILFPTAFAAFPEAILRQGSYLSTGEYRIWYFQAVSPRFGYGTIGWLLFAAAAIGLLVKRFDPFTAATASLLISPYAFHYDMTVACLGMGLALVREKRPQFQVLLIFGFFVPYLVLSGTTWLAPPIILCALYALTAVDSDPSWDRRNLIPKW